MEGPPTIWRKGRAARCLGSFGEGAHASCLVVLTRCGTDITQPQHLQSRCRMLQRGLAWCGCLPRWHKCTALARGKTDCQRDRETHQTLSPSDSKYHSKSKLHCYLLHKNNRLYYFNPIVNIYSSANKQLYNKTKKSRLLLIYSKCFRHFCSRPDQ